MIDIRCPCKDASQYFKYLASRFAEFFACFANNHMPAESLLCSLFALSVVASRPYKPGIEREGL
jgi:hypothetical protein